MLPLRRLIPIPVALSAALLAAAPADAALRAHDFESALPARAVAAATHGWVTLPARRVAASFDLLGLRWHGGTARAMARVHRAGLGWSAWLGLDAVGTGRGGDVVTEPLWTATADRYQVRLSRPVAGGRVHFVRVSGHAPARARAALATPGPVPTIIPRAAWNPGDQCAPRAAPYYGRVDMAFVHDTVTANDYAPADSAGIVLAICRYHRNSNGWNDIGYNFLVDRYGQVFEGRAGGIERPVTGAQAQGYNSFSTGISNIGTFTSVPQTEPGIQSLSRLIGWKLSLTATPTQGTVQEVSGGGPLNRFPAGTKLTFNRIAGHRDGDATDCPGDALYAQLPRIRALAGQSAGAPAPARLSAQPLTRHVRFPAAAQLKGTLTLAGGTPASGRSVLIQRHSGKRWVTASSAVVAADGTWRGSVALGWGAALRAYWPGEGASRALSSSGFAFTILPMLTARVARTHVTAGRSAILSGTVAPRKARLSVTLERRSKGRFRPLRAFGVGASSGRFRIAVKLHSPGLYALVVRSPADAHNPAGQAPWVYLRGLQGR